MQICVREDHNISHELTANMESLNYLFEYTEYYNLCRTGRDISICPHVCINIACMYACIYV